MTDEAEIVDEGEWPPVSDARPVEGKARRVEDTRATLAFCLVGLLALVIVFLLVLLWCGRLKEHEFAEVAGVVVSPLIGLVGAVTGYYYGKSDR